MRTRGAPAVARVSRSEDVDVAGNTPSSSRVKSAEALALERLRSLTGDADSAFRLTKRLLQKRLVRSTATSRDALRRLDRIPAPGARRSPMPTNGWAAPIVSALC
jgi:hypothetical protein